MTTAEASVPAREPEQTLKPNAIGFLDSLVIGLASTAPAYSLAAVIGSLVVVVGIQAPGALLASFVPMFLIAGAFFYMNRANRDAGTTFSWVTRTLGPWMGWIGGWAVCMTGILVIGSLADVGARLPRRRLGFCGRLQGSRDGPRDLLHRRAHVDLHPGHRALGPRPERDDPRPGRGVAPLRRRRPGEGLGRRCGSTGDRPHVVVVLALRGRRQGGAGRGAPDRGLRLLGRRISSSTRSRRSR